MALHFAEDPKALAFVWKVFCEKHASLAEFRLAVSGDALLKQLHLTENARGPGKMQAHHCVAPLSPGFP